MLKNSKAVTWDQSYENTQNVGDCLVWCYVAFLMFADAFKDAKYFFFISIANVAILGIIFKYKYFTKVH